MSMTRRTFTEKNFYLAEFRGRSIAIALPGEDPPSLAPLERVLEDLAANGTRVVLLSQRRDLLEKVLPGDPLAQNQVNWLGLLWRRLQEAPHAAVLLDPGSFASRCRELMLQLRPAKLVWLDESGVFGRAEGGRVSVMDLQDLRARLDVGDEAQPLLGEIHAMLAGGLPGVNLCRVGDLADELFTYAGAGTFFTRERYADVRCLGLDDLDAAADLIARGVEEGYLVAREPAAIDHVLANGFGVFIEGRYLAGIASLLSHAGGRVGEIASIYTLTRFVGEGVGGQLVRFALGHAAESGYEYVFACTTSERVERFFVRCGFRVVDGADIPAEKWAGYDAERRQRIRCLRHDL